MLLDPLGVLGAQLDGSGGTSTSLVYPLLLKLLVGEPLLRMLVYFNISSAPVVPFLMTRASQLLCHFIS